MNNKKLLLLFVLCFFLKFILFDVIWCMESTFKSFSFPQTYFTKMALASLLALPLIFIRSRWYVIIASTVIDILLIVNLLYFRTYYTAIPWDSYFLANNLSDFTASVFDSLRWIDLGFPMLTAAFLLVISKQKLSSLRVKQVKAVKLLGICAVIPFAIVVAIVLSQGGYKKAYESLLIHSQTCGTPLYTIVGSLYYEHVQDKLEYTPAVEQEIKQWLSERPVHTPLLYRVEERNSCIIILCESLESWVLEKEVEGKEITPYLNMLLKEAQTVYAPYVQTQAKGARSIDAQLMLHTGLLPVNFGAFSARFPHNTYRSLAKAFKHKYPSSKAHLLTVDKKVVWNQGVVAQDFGYDSLLDKPYFELDEKTGPMKKLGDISFLRQSAEKMEQEELFPTQGNTLIQCITYSGHAPFIIPQESKRITFSDKIPQRMKDYITTVNYTDYAIGEFIKRIRSQKKYERTLIVITGDHEGLANNRKEMCNHLAGKGVISPHQFTPFIAINAPLGLRYDKVMGQIDMYPTLLNLLGLDDYYWTGLGQSIFSPQKKGFAISPQLEIIGDTIGVCVTEIEHAKWAWIISDLIIRTNYFAR